MLNRFLIAVLMENRTLELMGNWTFPSNTSRSLVTHTTSSDNESMKNNYYTIALIGLGMVIYGLLWLRRKRNREKYLQKREQEYLEYFHKILPQSRIYGDISDKNNIETMVKSFHGVKDRAISIQHGLASIAGLVINVNQTPDHEMEEEADDFRYSEKADDLRYSDINEVGTLTEEYREFTNLSTYDKASIQIHHDGIEDIRNDVYNQSDEFMSELHNEKSTIQHDDMTCGMLQHSVSNSLGVICEESENETEKERSSNKVRCEVHSEMTSSEQQIPNRKVHGELDGENPCAFHDEMTHREQQIPNRVHRTVHGELFGEIPCVFQGEMRRTEKLSNNLHGEIQSEIDSVSTKSADTDKIIYYDNNIHKHDTGIKTSSTKERKSRTEKELNSPLCKSLSEGDDEVFMITEYTDNADCITGEKNNLTIADIHLDFPDESKAFSVLNKPQYATNSSPVSKWQENGNLQAVHDPRDMNGEYELEKYELGKRKQVNGLHLITSDTCNGKFMDKTLYETKDELSGHKTLRNKLKSDDNFHEDFVTCTWI